jgi:hypothetical protein
MLTRVRAPATYTSLVSFSWFTGGNPPQLPPTPTTASMEPSMKKKRGMWATLRWRTLLLLGMLFFIMLAHVLTHGLATRRPRLFPSHLATDTYVNTNVNVAAMDASVAPIAIAHSNSHGMNTVAVGTPASSGAGGKTFGKLFDLEWIFPGGREEVEERDFVIEVLGPAARR